MAEQNANSRDRWHGRPVQAAIVRVFVVGVPVGAAVLISILFSAAVPYPDGVALVILWWVAVMAVSTLGLVLVDRQARRLLPLAALLKLSMVFPDRAPSRFGVALRAGTVRNLQERLDQVREEGVDDEPAQAARQILELVGMLNAHDRGTRGHAERVRALTDLLAEQMGLSADDRDRLHWAALLHDVGKVMVPTHVLNKNGPPDDEEWATIHRHPEEGDRLAAPLRPWLGPWADTILQHHERWDGAGYPHGLAGEKISQGARMVAVADAFEVMTAPRPYKRAMDVKAAREELTRCAGTHFDPAAVRAFLNVSLGRLRWLVGPVAWLAELPFLQGFPSGVPSQVAAIGARAVTGAALFAGVAAPALTSSGPTAAAPAPRPAVTTTVPGVAAPPTVPVAGPTATATRAPSTTAAPRVAAPATQPRPVVTAPPPPPPTTTTRPNVPPIARPDSATTTQHKPVDVAVLANDVDPDGGGLVAPVTILTPPAHANANPATDGDVHYVPFDKFTGVDSFVYQVCDNRGACVTATVTITVHP
jgi:HD domain-containing protein/Big-like domain-containing protein